MITLRKMRADEYPDYRACFIDDYSKEIVENYGLSLSQAVTQAEADIDSTFPDTPDSDDEQLLCLEADLEQGSMVVGYLWLSINTDGGTAFISDFFVKEEYRNQGYGKQAMTALETFLVSQRIRQIKLRVAYHNQRALKLYQEIGFNITGYNMFKEIGG